MYLELAIRMLMGGIFGGVIGIERKHRFKQAGFKTHFLVGLGSTLIMIISKYGFLDTQTAVDPSRIAAQVVSGIGFLGVGTIMVNREGVTGLTTAAGLWVTSAIGLAIGNGMYAIATITTILVIIGLEGFNTGSIFNRNKMVEVYIVSEDNIFPNILEGSCFKKVKITVFQCKAIDDCKFVYEFSVAVKVKRKVDINQIINYFSNLKGVVSVKIYLH